MLGQLYLVAVSSQRGRVDYLKRSHQDTSRAERQLNGWRRETEAGCPTFREADLLAASRQLRRKIVIRNHKSHRQPPVIIAGARSSLVSATLFLPRYWRSFFFFGDATPAGLPHRPMATHQRAATSASVFGGVETAATWRWARVNARVSGSEHPCALICLGFSQKQQAD